MHSYLTYVCFSSIGVNFESLLTAGKLNKYNCLNLSILDGMHVKNEQYNMVETLCPTTLIPFHIVRLTVHPSVHKYILQKLIN